MRHIHVDIQLVYVEMQPSYVNMQDIHFDMQTIYVDIQLIYVLYATYLCDMKRKINMLTCIILFVYLVC